MGFTSSVSAWSGVYLAKGNTIKPIEVSAITGMRSL